MILTCIRCSGVSGIGVWSPAALYCERCKPEGWDEKLRPAPAPALTCTTVPCVEETNLDEFEF